ncbi:uncharacterized protein BYT42DRAFT_584544 [Radiomyces spectabilis]|uniref:uncharacterized protein n=1 Tax=Radiomyces spectabilis TaxID=64574 RepID=UPI0022202CB4|nr:uncharacterized protein BYT42DRAFT_584544 [Radiomyces spectabilis]KAI8369456.1 hypothetical protein BYT42DRAFT_584544 [Radiomyces spectabilis]
MTYNFSSIVRFSLSSLSCVRCLLVVQTKKGRIGGGRKRTKTSLTLTLLSLYLLLILNFRKKLSTATMGHRFHLVRFYFSVASKVPTALIIPFSGYNIQKCAILATLPFNVLNAI